MRVGKTVTLVTGFSQKKNWLTMKKLIKLNESDIQRIVTECMKNILTEDSYIDILQDIYGKYNEFDMLCEFESDKRNGVKTVQFDLIPSKQYKVLLQRYMSAQHPSMARIPDNVVDSWIEKIVENLTKISYITNFAGHSEYFPSCDLENYYGNEDGVDWEDYGEASDFLDKIGFYDWCRLHDGSDAWSDYGIKPIDNILREYRPDMESWQKLMLINRILNVSHMRGDLASAFIEGGFKTCSEISGQTHGR